MRRQPRRQLAAAAVVLAAECTPGRSAESCCCASSQVGLAVTVQLLRWGWLLLRIFPGGAGPEPALLTLVQTPRRRLTTAANTAPHATADAPRCLQVTTTFGCRTATWQQHTRCGGWKCSSWRRSSSSSSRRLRRQRRQPKQLPTERRFLLGITCVAKGHETLVLQCSITLSSQLGFEYTKWAQ